MGLNYKNNSIFAHQLEKVAAKCADRNECQPA